jgi:hypothetical protein
MLPSVIGGPGCDRGCLAMVGSVAGVPYSGRALPSYINVIAFGPPM